jgi:hypothetical protein
MRNRFSTLYDTATSWFMRFRLNIFEDCQPFVPTFVINYTTIEQVQNFDYLGCDVSYSEGKHLEQKLSRF